MPNRFRQNCPLVYPEDTDCESDNELATETIALIDSISRHNKNRRRFRGFRRAHRPNIDTPVEEESNCPSLNHMRTCKICRSNIKRLEGVKLKDEVKKLNNKIQRFQNINEVNSIPKPKNTMWCVIIIVVLIFIILLLLTWTWIKNLL